MSNESSLPASSLWFYADASNQPVGPIPFAELEKLAETGVIQPRTKVIEADGTEWKRFAAIAPSQPVQTPASLAQPAESSPPPNSLWFYADASNQPVGPVPFAELEKFVTAGVIQPKTQVFEKGGGEWRAFATIAPAPTAQTVAPRTQPMPANAPRRKLTILTLGFFYPVGLWMLWKNNDFSKRTKTLVTSICSPIFLLGTPLWQKALIHPITLFLIWVWLGKFFSKASKIVLSAVCTVLFLPILFPPNPNAKNASGSFSPSAPHRAAGAPTLGMTPEKFRTAFNAKSVALNLSHRFHIGNIPVVSGAVKNTLMFSFSDSLSVAGSVDKASGEIDSLWVCANGGTEERAADLLLLPTVIVATLDTSISKERRGEVVLELYSKASSDIGQQFSSVEGTLKLSTLEDSNLGMMMFFVSPKAAQIAPNAPFRQEITREATHTEPRPQSEEEVRPAWKAGALRVGDNCRLVSRAMLFADESAYNDFVVAKKTGDTAKLDMLEKTNRAFSNKAGGRALVIAVNGLRNLVRVRCWSENTSAEFWTFQTYIAQDLPEPSAP